MLIEQFEYLLRMTYDYTIYWSTKIFLSSCKCGHARFALSRYWSSVLRHMVRHIAACCKIDQIWGFLTPWAYTMHRRARQCSLSHTCQTFPDWWRVVGVGALKFTIWDTYSGSGFATTRLIVSNCPVNTELSSTFIANLKHLAHHRQTI